MTFKPSARILLPFLLLSHLLLLFFTRFTLWPEMVVYPYLVNHGFLLYRDIISPYPPLLIYKLAFFAKIFGYQPLPYQILTWLTILTCDIAIFLTVARITKSLKPALVSTLFFIVLSIPFGVNGLWFDLVQTPPVIVAVYFFARHFVKKQDTIDILICSLALAVAFFIKQQVLWLILWFVAVLIYKKIKDPKKLARPIFIIIAPIIIGFGLEFLFLFPKNLFSDFVTWTIVLPFFKASSMPGYVLLPTLRQLLPVAAIFLIFLPQLKSDFSQKFYLGSAAVLLFFAYPRFDYFHLIPTLSILALIFRADVITFKNYRKMAVLIALASALFLALFTLRYLQRNWTHEVRFFEHDVYQTASTIAKLNKSGKPIFLQNVSGQVLPLSGTLPTKPWADSFPWYLEMPGVQTNIIAGILNERPQIVLYKPYGPGDTYLIGAYRPTVLANFLDQGYNQMYKLEGTLFIKIRY